MHTSPAKSVLMGITRNTIIEICKRQDIKVIEDSINYKDLKLVDGLFISGTSPKVLPISNVDDICYDSAANKIIKVIESEYDNDIKIYIENAKRK